MPDTAPIPFDFDTGDAPRVNLFSTDAARNLLDSVRDHRPDATEGQVNDLLCQTICGELRARKTGEGVARTFWKYAVLISRMREHSPDCHEQVILEFAELLTATTWRHRQVRAGADSPAEQRSNEQ